MWPAARFQATPLQAVQPDKIPRPAAHAGNARKFSSIDKQIIRRIINYIVMGTGGTASRDFGEDFAKIDPGALGRRARTVCSGCALAEQVARKAELVTGSYTGDREASRTIELVFP